MHEHTAKLLGGSEKRRRRGLHYSLDIMSFFKDLTQKLVKSFFTNQNKDMSRHIVKSFFANRQKRHVHYKHIVKSFFFANHEQRHVQYKHFVKSFFFANHELKDMSITNLKTDQERKTLGMILSTIRKVERL